MAENDATIFGDSGDSMETGGSQYGESVFYVAVALITIRYGRRWWLLFEGLVSLVIAGMTVASPKFAFETAMGSLVGEYDDCHNIVIRGYGILFLVRSGKLLFCRNSTDQRGVSAMLEGLSMIFALESICHVPLVWVGKDLGKVLHYPEKSFPFFLGLMLGNIAHLVAGESGYKDFRTPSASNLSARFDALAQFVIGGSLYAFPKEVLTLMMTKSDFDNAQVLTMAVIGCYCLGNSVESLQAESFTQDVTRKNMYRGRIIECLSLTLLILFHWTFTDILTSHSLLAVPMYGILAGNAFIAMNSAPPKMKE